MGKTYLPGWEKDRHWLKSVKGYKPQVSQFKSHSKGPVYSAKEDF